MSKEKFMEWMERQIEMENRLKQLEDSEERSFMTNPYAHLLTD